MKSNYEQDKNKKSSNNVLSELGPFRVHKFVRLMKMKLRNCSFVHVCIVDVKIWFAVHHAP